MAHGPHECNGDDHHDNPATNSKVDNLFGSRKKHESNGSSANKKKENDARGKVPEYMIRTNGSDVLLKEEKSNKIGSIKPVAIANESDCS